MLNKELLIKMANEAHKNGAVLYITFQSGIAKYYTHENLCSHDFLLKYGLTYEDLILGIRPWDMLKHDYVIYKSDMNIDTFIEEANKDYFKKELC